MASLGQLVAGVAHEINNPLSYVTNNLAVLDRDVRQVADLMARYRDHFGDSVPDRDPRGRGADRPRLHARQPRPAAPEHPPGPASGSARSSTASATSPGSTRPTSKQVDPNEAVRVTVEMVRFHVRQKGVELKVETEPAADDLVQSRPDQPGPAQPDHERDPGRRARGDDHRPDPIPPRDRTRSSIEVADDGPGIPESIRGKIFDPFFTTKPQGVGTGLGLWITYNIVEQHGGGSTWRPSPASGTTFTITLPVRRPGDPAPTPISPGPRSILADIDGRSS